MNPDLSHLSPEEQEIHLTSLLLGELSPAEETALRQLIAQNPALARLHDRLKQTIDLVRQASHPAGNMASNSSPSAPLRLSEARRQALLDELRKKPAPAANNVQSVPKHRDLAWYVPMSLAACLVFLLALPVSFLDQKGHLLFSWKRAQSTGNIKGIPTKDVAKESWVFSSRDEQSTALSQEAGKAVNAFVNDDISAIKGPQRGQARTPFEMLTNRLGRISTGDDYAEKLGRGVVPAQRSRELHNELRVAGVSEQTRSLERPESIPAPMAPPIADKGKVYFADGVEVVKNRAAQASKPLKSEAEAAKLVASVQQPAASTPVDNKGKPAMAADVRQQVERRRFGLPSPGQQIPSRSTKGAAVLDTGARSSMGGGTFVAEANRGELGATGGGVGGVSGFGGVGGGGYGGLQPVLGDKPVAGRLFGNYQIDGDSEPKDRLDRNVLDLARDSSKPSISLGTTLALTPATPALTPSLAPTSAGAAVIAAAEPAEAVGLRVMQDQELTEQVQEVEATDGLRTVHSTQGVLAGDEVRLKMQLPEEKAGKPSSAAEGAQKATALLKPQPEILASENPFSTFSLNVSDVSFKLAASSLENGVMPEPVLIRSEEFVNAFDYRDPVPAPGQPLAFACERARYPFAHNREIIRLAVKTASQGRETGRPMNLVLVLDNSGSMERADRVQIIRVALKVLAGQLKPQDRVSVVAFARTARLCVDGLAGSEAAQLEEQVGNLTPEGGTNLEDALNLAYQTALRHFLVGGMNRLVLLTDGAANLGNTDAASLKAKVEQFRKRGIALDCFGIGWEGYNDDLLEVLSRNADGRYGFINDPEQATVDFVRQLAGALQAAASDVKVQVEFNPRRVASYRQIGYAKHQLTQEQFRDNTVDAAEIGAAESGNALYLLEINPQGHGNIGTVRVRFKTPGTEDYQEHEWPISYTGVALSLDQCTPAMRLAVSAAAFSEWLAQSPYGQDVSLDELMRNLGGIPAAFNPDPRPNKLVDMIRQAQAIAPQ